MSHFDSPARPTGRALTLSLLLGLSACYEGITFEEWLEPDLTIHSPQPGELLEQPVAHVTGHVENMDTVRINGILVPVDANGDFATDAPLAYGMNHLEVVGVRDDGEVRYERRTVMTGEYADPDASIQDAVLLRVNRSALDMAAATVEGMIDPAMLTQRVYALNPVFDQNSFWVTAYGNVERVHFGQPRIWFQPSAESIEARVSMPDIFISVGAWGQVLGYGFDVDATVQADDIQLGLGIALSAVDGDLQLGLHHVDLELIGFDFDTSLIPDAVEDLLLVDKVIDALEGVAEDLATEVLTPLLATALQDMDLSFDTELRGVPLSADLAFSQAFTDSDGVALAANVDIDMPAADSREFPGYLRNPTGTPPPLLSRDASVAVSISDDFLNSLLYDVWRAGLIDITLSTEDGTLNSEMAEQLKAEQASLHITSSLPPMVTQWGDRLQLRIGELGVEILTPDGELGERLQMALGLDIDLDPRTQHGVMALGMGEPAVNLMVREADWGASEEATTNLMEGMLPIAELLAPLNALEIPMPEFDAGGGVRSIDVLRDPSRSHTNVLVELESR